MSKTISIDQLSEAIAEELTLYNTHIIDGIKTETKKSIKRLVKKTKDTAPVGNRKNHYRDSITSKKLSENERGVSYLWYVKGSDYRLSHLLNNGHALRDGGRYKGTQFITKAEESTVKEYETKIEEVIKNG